MAEVLAEIGEVKFTVRTAGMIAVLLTLLVFTLFRKAMNKKASQETGMLLRWLDGMGFGLLPAAVVWKIFETQYACNGREVFKPLLKIAWLTENGRFIPCNTEMTAGLLCFAGLCIWLMLRKNDLTGRGDLLMVSLCLWSGIRIVTESLREAPDNVLRFVYCAIILICLAIWTARLQKQPQSKQRSIGSWLAAILCTAMIVLTSSGTLSVGSEIGDLSVITGCTVLTILLTLLCGSDSRSIFG